MALTSLVAVKTWLGVTTTTDDVLLTRLLNQVSTATLSYLQRPNLARATYSELRNGVGNQRMTLRNWPVVSVSSLFVAGHSVPAGLLPATASALTPGYTLSQWDGTGSGNLQELTLVGYSFIRGNNNVQINYIAGYCVLAQPATVPATGPYNINITPPGGSWSQDDGVAYANGTAFTSIRSGTPTAGQYLITPSEALPGTVVYTFAAADEGQAITISYSYTPSDLEEGVIEWIGERYRYKERIGQKTKSVGGTETAGYNLAGVPDFIQGIFEPYKKFLPL